MAARLAPPLWRRTATDVVVSELGFIARENVAVIVLLAATPVAFDAGVVAVTVGAAMVVKVQVNADASAIPSAEVAPVEMVAV